VDMTLSRNSSMEVRRDSASKRGNRVLMSIRKPSTGRYGLCTVRWNFIVDIKRSSLLRIISVAFSLSPRTLATNWVIEMLNSSILQAK